jgi:hypothetical protein
MTTTTEPLTGLAALPVLEKQAREFIQSCEASGFRDITIIDMVKAQMDFLTMEALQNQAAPVAKFHSKEAAIAFAELRKDKPQA